MELNPEKIFWNNTDYDTRFVIDITFKPYED